MTGPLARTSASRSTSANPTALALPFDELRKEHVSIVGGKCANLGELTAMGAKVPPGFAVTAHSYKRFLIESGLQPRIDEVLRGIPAAAGPEAFEAASRTIRELIESAPMPDAVAEAIRAGYRMLAARLSESEPAVAVRSSATAEDLPDASFAGQQDTFLNVRGAERVIHFVQRCWASLFTPRAIFYRLERGYGHEQVHIAVAVQRLVDARASGVCFTIDPVTGDPDRIVIEATWGLGEALVSGRVTPDRFVLSKRTRQVLERSVAPKRTQWTAASDGELTKETRIAEEDVQTPALTDAELQRLAEATITIESKYGRPQDIEFAFEGENGSGVLWILQARPETVHSRNASRPAQEAEPLPAPTGLVPLLKGSPASPGVRAGRASVVATPEEAGVRVQPGDILVTRMTNPDWVPYMKRAGAIVTEDGGVTCHAAIVSREMGIPCIVGARDAMKRLETGKMYTVDAKSGVVYEGERTELTQRAERNAAAQGLGPIAVPITATKVYVNLSIPELAEKVARETRADGVGLLRAEHLMLSVGKHPRQLIEENGAEAMVEAFADGIRKVAAAFHPKPVVYRFLDFKPDEFLGLPGGEKYEREAGHVGPNPLIGYRGAFRYLKEPDIFRLECEAIRRVREDHGLTNVNVMFPFVRTVQEFKRAKRLMEATGLERGPDFKVWIMVEVPSTVLLIDQFVQAGIDGVSFGTNDLTMLILGIDRDDASVQELYDERNLAVVRALSHVIRTCNAAGVTTSVCGQAPSNYPELVEFLVREGATSMSVNVDKVLETKALVAGLERKVILDNARAQAASAPLLRPAWTP